MLKVDDLTADEIHDFHERAGIMEYDGGLSRQEADKSAFEMILRQRETNRLR